ncbi:MAG: hypothetical protein ACR2P4_08585 [Gammaproteobacteria bacterium]
MADLAAATVMPGTGYVLPVAYGNDQGILVEFYKDVKSGKPYVSMRFAGDKHTDVRREVRESDKRRFPMHWKAFEEGTSQFEGQTTIEELPFVDEAARMHLKALHIFTAESLASVSDGNLKNIGMGARDLRQKAQKFLEEKAKSAGYDELKAKEAQYESDKAEMQARIAELEAQFSKPKRGRPPKA